MVRYFILIYFWNDQHAIKVKLSIKVILSEMALNGIAKWIY